MLASATCISATLAPSSPAPRNAFALARISFSLAISSGVVPAAICADLNPAEPLSPLAARACCAPTSAKPPAPPISLPYNSVTPDC